jgi:hypothetical protein
MQVANYSSAVASRQALEDRLKAEALRTGVPYDRLRKEAAVPADVGTWAWHRPQDAELPDHPSGQAIPSFLAVMVVGAPTMPSITRT